MGKLNKKIIIGIGALIIVCVFIFNFYSGEGKFVETGEMNLPRIAHAATLLNDGRVLITGGLCVGTNKDDPNCSKTAEIYDPNTGQFTRIKDMHLRRAYHTSTLLKDGRVLIVGAGKLNAEIYNPKTGEFTLTGNMPVDLIGAYTCVPKAILLKDGRVLIIGVARQHSDETWSEIYDPKTGEFTDIGKTHLYHNKHTATLLPDGKVLIAGGRKAIHYDSYYYDPVVKKARRRFKYIPQNAELYDPVTNKFTITGKPLNLMNRLTATLLTNNKVLLVGYHSGSNIDPPDIKSGTFADLYDYKIGTFTASKGKKKGKVHSGTTATLLKNGKVLFLGTNGDKQELYDPVKDKFNDTKRVKLNNFWRTATLLQNGDVLITGGSKRGRAWWMPASSNKALLYKY